MNETLLSRYFPLLLPRLREYRGIKAEKVKELEDGEEFYEMLSSGTDMAIRLTNSKQLQLSVQGLHKV